MDIKLPISKKTILSR